MTFQWRPPISARAQDVGTPSAPVSPLTIEIRPSHAPRPGHVASRISFLESLAKSAPPIPLGPAASHLRVPRPLFSPGIGSQFKRTATERRLRSEERSGEMKETGRTFQDDPTSIASRNSMAGNSKSDLQMEQEDQPRHWSPIPHSSYTSILLSPLDTPKREITYSDTIDSEISITTSSTDRRQSVRELFDNYGIERPEELASPEADTRSEPVVLYRYCHNCSRLNGLLNNKCWMCGHRLCIECELPRTSPSSDSTTTGQYTRSLASRANNHAITDSTAWKGQRASGVRHEHPSGWMHTAERDHARRGEELVGLDRSVSKNNSEIRLPFRTPPSRQSKASSTIAKPFVLADHRLSMLHAPTASNADNRRRRSFFDQLNGLQGDTARALPRHSPHAPSHEPRVSPRNYDDKSKRPFLSSADQERPCLPAHLKNEPHPRAPSSEVLDETSSRISIALSAPAIEQTTVETQRRPQTASPAHIVINTTSHRHITEYSPFPPATYQKSGPEYFELKSHNHDFGVSTHSSLNFEDLNVSSPPRPKVSTRARALSQLLEKRTIPAQQQQSARAEKILQSSEQESTRSKALSHLKLRGATSAPEEPNQERNRVSRLANERIAFFNEPKEKIGRTAERITVERKHEEPIVAEIEVLASQPAPRSVGYERTIPQAAEDLGSNIQTESDEPQKTTEAYELEDLELKQMTTLSELFTPLNPEDMAELDHAGSEDTASVESSLLFSTQAERTFFSKKTNPGPPFQVDIDRRSGSPFSPNIPEGILHTRRETPEHEATKVAPETFEDALEQEAKTPHTDDVPEAEVLDDLRLLGITVIVHFESSDDLVLKIDLSRNGTGEGRAEWVRAGEGSED